MPKSLSISLEELTKLKNYIMEHGLRRDAVKSEYELMRIKNGDINIVVYKSGKLVYEDNSSTQKLLEAIFQEEKGYDYILGTDEVGKGEWYGPLVVEGVALTPNEINILRKIGVRDSKVLSKRSLEDIGNKLVKMEFIRSPLVLMPEKYNEMYIKFKNEGKTLNDMLAWAHSAVIKDLLERLEFKKAKVIIDKFDAEKTDLRLKRINKADVEIIQKSKGEAEIPVATASIIAKFIFEEKVDELNKKFNIDLKKMEPKDIDKNVLPFVGKLHFKNVSQYLS